MKISTYIPSALLAPYIKSYMVIESIEGMKNAILPETTLVMAFSLRGNVDYINNNNKEVLPSAVITGIRKHTRQLTYNYNTATLLVKFREGSASLFFNEPLHELAGNSYSLDTLIQHSKIEEVEEKLSEAKTHSEYIAIVEVFLVSLRKQKQTDLLVAHAIRQMQHNNGIVSINELIKSIPLSRDAFEKRFRKATGTSPKQFATIIRLNTLINNHDSEYSLTTAAYSAGYYDQSHLIKDFRSFTGQSPANFFRTKIWW